MTFPMFHGFFKQTEEKMYQNRLKTLTGTEHTFRDRFEKWPRRLN